MSEKMNKKMLIDHIIFIKENFFRRSWRTA
jgi:hypothetical protein